MSPKVEEWTVLSMLEWATDFFTEKNIPDPRHSIEWLLAETLGIKRLDLYLKFDRPLSAKELDTLRPMVKRRANHEPLQYIIGYTDFIHAQISVNEHVLIPRIETEQLVEIILDDHPAETEKNVLDIGTGSGCIPIALKMERPQWQISGIDISVEALEVAKENADANEVSISFKEADIFAPEAIKVEQPLKIIVSNPPYITPEEEDLLEPQVRTYEPRQALFVDDMAAIYQNIIKFARLNLAAQGMLYLELHEEYANQIHSLFDQKVWQTTLKKDYDDKPRFIVAKHL